MKRSTVIFLVGGLVVMFGFMGWAFYSTRSIGFGPGGGPITVMIVAGVAGTGLLTGVLMWLAFYSSRKGYDENPKFETKPDEPRQD
jgi:cation transporter-like permease